MMSYTARARCLDKFGQQWSKKTSEIRNGCELQQVPKFMLIIDNLHYTCMKTYYLGQTTLKHACVPF